MIKLGITLSWLRSITNQANSSDRTYDKTVEHFGVIRNLETKLSEYEEYLEVEILLRTVRSRARLVAERGKEFLEVYKLMWLRDFSSHTDFTLPSAAINATHLRSRKSKTIYKILQDQGLNPSVTFFPSKSSSDEDNGHGHCSIVIRW